MPKAITETLGLSVTRPCHDLFAFESRVVQCLGVIKDFVVNLAQLPMKSVMMDVVVTDIPPKFGVFLSRSWEKRVGGSLQMDLSYATIPIFGGVWKLNLGVRTITLTKISNYTCKITHKGDWIWSRTLICIE